MFPFPLFLHLILTIAQTADTRVDAVQVWHQSFPDGGFTLHVNNQNFCPAQIWVDMTEMVNLRTDEELPYIAVVPERSEGIPFLTLKPSNPRTKIRYRTEWYYGDPSTAKHNDGYIYTLPFDDGAARILIQGYNGTFSHAGIFALDFMMPEGNLICAARDGIVVAVREDSDKGGPDPAMMDYANFIKVYHEDGSFADYTHLRYDGALVSPGDRVYAGQRIGISGNTGFSSRPHLHFAVSVPTVRGSKTIPVKFLGRGGTTIEPKEGQMYTSFHGNRR